MGSEWLSIAHVLLGGSDTGSEIFEIEMQPMVKKKGSHHEMKPAKKKKTQRWAFTGASNQKLCFCPYVGLWEIDQLSA